VELGVMFLSSRSYAECGNERSDATSSGRALKPDRSSRPVRFKPLPWAWLPEKGRGKYIYSFSYRLV